ncbi:hypothetical protein [Solibacillus sp. CAU 1738]|uniref:hypothetical protein n=1 Tax=Solibacillus sp. CAU 1738 TaxID=3140363 RepID=UPI003261C5C0
MKMKLSICMLFFALLIGCTAENTELNGEITKIQVQKNTNEKEERIIKDKETLELLKSYLEKILWENAKIEMSRKQDVTITLSIDLDSKEILKEYDIWFNNDNSATFINYNEQKKGTLNKEDANGFKEILMNKQRFCFP